MFCDLADSTHLSAGLDPEDMGDVIRAYHEAVSEAVRRFDGYIAKFMGDGVSKRKYLMSSQPRRIRRKSCAGSSIGSGRRKFRGTRSGGFASEPKSWLRQEISVAK